MHIYMARYLPEHEELFKKKVLENYQAGQELFKQHKYNASATRYYYSFILLALKNVAMYGNAIPEEYYSLSIGGKIDKQKIKNNPKGLNIQKPADFRAGIISAEGARVKADYFPEAVEPEQIESFLPRLKTVLEANGVINEHK